jgi:hypothetical protein
MTEIIDISLDINEDTVVSPRTLNSIKKGWPQLVRKFMNCINSV